MVQAATPQCALEVSEVQTPRVGMDRSGQPCDPLRTHPAWSQPPIRIILGSPALLGPIRMILGSPAPSQPVTIILGSPASSTNPNVSGFSCSSWTNKNHSGFSCTSLTNQNDFSVSCCPWSNQSHPSAFCSSLLLPSTVSSLLVLLHLFDIYF